MLSDSLRPASLALIPVHMDLWIPSQQRINTQTCIHGQKKNDSSASGSHGGGRPHLDSSVLTAIEHSGVQEGGFAVSLPGNETCEGASRVLTPLSHPSYLLHPVLARMARRFEAGCTASSCALC